VPADATSAVVEVTPTIEQDGVKVESIKKIIAIQ
jgi:hypothetical protein